MEGDGGEWAGDRPYPCYTCSKKYLRKNNLEDHVLMEHPDTTQAADVVAYKASKGRSKGSLIVQCDICSKRFRYASDLKNHFESHFRGRGRGRGSGASPGPGRPPGRPPRDPDAPPRVKTTRPCLYCGRTFSDREVLLRHESSEAIEFEREASRFEEARRGRVALSDLEAAPRQSFHQVDRTDEEFGDEEEGSLEIDLSYPGRVGPLVSPSLYPSPAFTPRLPIDTYDATVPQPVLAAALPGPPYPQHNHTSQYSQDYTLPAPSYPSPPPAHEDPTTAHGFLPPPPALPLPENFSQGCHRPTSVVAELPNPMEERTFTVLQSKDETVSSCLVSMSPSREVLDLSMPKLELSDHEPAKEEEVEAVMTNGHGLAEAADQALDFSIKCEEQMQNGHFHEDVPEEVEQVEIDDAKLVQTILSDILEAVFNKDSNCLNDKENIQREEEHSDDSQEVNGVNGVDLPDGDTNNTYVVKVKRVKIEKDEEDSEEDEELVIFEPKRMPVMPEANISLAEERRGGKKGLFERGLTADEWREFEDYAGLMDEEEEEDMFEDDRSSSPVQFDDPNRIDCKFCGMIFNDAHVRKFHEQSHTDIEDVYDDNDLTRLFCGFCGKTFKKAQYRLMHEKGHTGELPISCANCTRQFRWESELKAHNKLFCSRDRPAGAFRNKPGPKPKKFREEKLLQKDRGRPRLVEQDGWEENTTSLPSGWKMRTRPRPAQEGQLYFIFLSPDHQVFHSRKAVMQHMEATGSYSAGDFNRVRQLAKPGPRANLVHRAKLQAKKKLGLLHGVKRGPGRPSKAEMELRERELMRLHREETDREARQSLDLDSNTSNSGFRINYKEESDTGDSDDGEGGSNLRVKRRKKKLQPKKRKTA